MKTNIELQYGNNFDQKDLSYKEFTYTKDTEGGKIPRYNNFALEFWPYKEGAGRNYQRLKMVDEKLANELSTVFYHYQRSEEKINEVLIKGHGYPEHVLKKLYRAYLILRKEFKNDESLLKKIKEYRNNYPNENICDDWAAFFS
jgi:hypothetical protein